MTKDIWGLTSDRNTFTAVTRTYLGNVSLGVSNPSVLSDEPLTLSVGFKVLGELRERFIQSAWEEAYRVHDARLRITYAVQLRKKMGKVLSKAVGKPVKIVRKAVLFWTRNPKRLNRIWVMVVDENMNSTVPNSEREAQSLLFDVNKTIDFIGADLGKGRHTLSAKVTVRWGKYHFVQHGSAEAISPPVVLECR